MRLALIVLALLQAATAQAQAYKWVDGDGVVHLTDNPWTLPEPQRTRVLEDLERKRKKEDEERRKAAPSRQPDLLPPTEPAARAPEAPPEELDQLRHRAADEPLATDGAPDGKFVEGDMPSEKLDPAEAVKFGRERIADLEKRCTALESKQNESHRAALLFARPGARENAAEAGAKLEACKADLAQARQELEQRIEQARRSGIPPGKL